MIKKQITQHSIFGYTLGILTVVILFSCSQCFGASQCLTDPVPTQTSCPQPPNPPNPNDSGIRIKYRLSSSNFRIYHLSKQYPIYFYYKSNSGIIPIGTDNNLPGWSSNLQVKINNKPRPQILLSECVDRYINTETCPADNAANPDFCGACRGSPCYTCNSSNCKACGTDNQCHVICTGSQTCDGAGHCN